MWNNVRFFPDDGYVREIRKKLKVEAYYLLSSTLIFRETLRRELWTLMKRRKKEEFTACASEQLQKAESLQLFGECKKRLQALSKRNSSIFHNHKRNKELHENKKFKAEGE